MKDVISKEYPRIILTEAVSVYLIESPIEGKGLRDTLPIGFCGKIIDILKINSHYADVMLENDYPPEVSYMIRLTNNNFKIIVGE